MILQHVIFSDSGLDGTESLYSSTHAGKFPLHLERCEEVDFFGYFNYFSLDKWCKYLDPDSIFLDICGSGIAILEFWLFQEKTSKKIKNVQINCLNCHVQIPHCMSGLLGVKIISKDDVLLKSIQFETSEVGSDICIGINLCTYRRKKFVDLKVNAFNRALSLDYDLSKRMELFIIDNDSSIPLTEYCCKNIKIIHNENTGGSGGFTRGIKEISSDNRFTHILMMDDDTIVEPESLYRIWAFLKISYAHDPNLIVGGAMLSLEDRCKVVEGSATFKQMIIKPNKKGLDVSTTWGCDLFNKECDANYNGWWMCTYPVSYANYQNLPMQFFIKMDDVEYGIRSNMPVILLNGISVWHLDFSKKYVTSNVYYSTRNSLFVTKKYGTIDIKIKFFILKKLLSLVFCLRYRDAEYLIKGMFDYLKGYEWTANQKIELHEYLQKNSYIFSKEFVNDVPHTYSKAKTSLLKSFLTMNGIFLKYERDLPISVVSMKELYGVSKVKYYNCENKYFEESRNVFRAFRIIVHGFFVCIKLK